MSKSSVAVLAGVATGQSDKLRAMLILLGCEVLVMTVWFSSTAVIPQIADQPGSTSFRLAALTGAVQVGFVLGTLLSAVLRLADRLDPRKFFMWAALVAAATTLCLVWPPATSWYAILLRVLTGMALAGVYPVGLRLAGTWATNDLGLLMGLLVGALTLGSAAPHLVSSFLDVDFRLIYVVAATAAVVGAIGIRFFTIGHKVPPRGKLQLGQIAQMWRNRPLRLANIGYLGHMWELYAMWAWIGTFYVASFTGNDVRHPASAASIATFATIGVGAIGAILGGRCADRFGRTATTMGAMALSGSCALVMGWLVDAPPGVVLAVGLVWGVTVIADSAQFSASVSELSAPEAIGSMLTLQTCLGFLLTLGSIQLLGPVHESFGWPVAFSLLALGPFIGTFAMARLRASAASSRLAGGRR